MTTARQAIAILNDNKMLLPAKLTTFLAEIIVSAAARNDAEAIRWLWLFNWKPEQLVN